MGSHSCLSGTAEREANTKFGYCQKLNTCQVSVHLCLQMACFASLFKDFPGEKNGLLAFNSCHVI